MTKIPLKKGLYAITPELSDTALLLQQVELALSSGIAMLQYRDKTSSPKDKLLRANALRNLCTRFNTPLIINDDAELALACGAEGVHLGQTDGPIRHARKLLGESAIIGITCHHQFELAIEAEKEGADYIAFGRFFNSNSKPGSPLAKTDLLIKAKNKLSIPIVAIGGITHANAQPLIDNGVDYIAAIEQVFLATDIANNCRQFNRLFER